MLSYQAPLAFSGAGTPVQTLPRPVVIKQQCMNYWCWASVTELVSAYLDSAPRTQCQIASDFFDGCCPCPYPGYPGNEACNNPYDLVTALGPHCSNPQAAVGDFPTIVNEICTRQQPVACRIHLNDGSGYHYIVIIGVAIDAQVVRVADPLGHDGNALDLSFGQFCAGYSDGTWDQMITIQ
ncbi:MULTISPECIES: papain-like cysteine protease family protein [Paraburkholderia]|uniref:Uncharacterized protein n=1 Tax=Paraburkholderia madseniana TaxID=2599607 RepID=A0AAP5BDI3_9BURK|nr:MULTISPECIES: papain-like cysteine protease family protein [Paraburkholderia]MCX4146921.1 hypothetical protein [Paraburkholderia madseniana]MDN7149866.1 hypothetical protein [Paraburkholderia sp. WS6]MDQ6408746.1 hypothetical protein [Paraburkholderia madseniana]